MVFASYRSMGRPLRYVPPDQPIEVTNRTFQGRFLMLPTAEVRSMVLGALGRAQRRFTMPIHAFTFTSNHFHLLLTPRDASHLAEFMEFLESKIAREINRLHGWSGSLWGDRYHSIPIESDEEAQLSRLRYILSHGVKEGLVARAAEWPGANCVLALTEGTALRGKWYDRTAQYNSSRWGKKVDSEDFCEEEQVSLTPLPCLASLSQCEIQELVGRMIEEVEREAASHHHTAGTAPAGVRAILAHHPHERPAEIKRTPRPWFHAKTREGRAWMREAYRLFAESFRDAAALLARGIPDPGFPEGSFPPGQPFVPHQAPG